MTQATSVAPTPTPTTPVALGTLGDVVALGDVVVLGDVVALGDLVVLRDVVALFAGTGPGAARE